MIGQDIWQRVLTARSANVARWGGLIAGIYCLLYGLVGALIGTAARALLPDLSNPDNAFAAVADAMLPAGVLGLVLAAALAAIMSTESAGLLASSTILANDIYGGFVSRNLSDEYEASRISTLIVGIVVSLLTRPTSDRNAAAWEERMGQCGAALTRRIPSPGDRDHGYTGKTQDDRKQVTPCWSPGGSRRRYRARRARP